MSGNQGDIRLLDTGLSGAAYNMALDEAIAEAVCAGRSPLTLRFYGWSSPAVSIGRNQRAGDVDLAFCAESGIEVVRRPTGGRAILHGAELTYGFAAPISDRRFGQGVLGAYGVLSGAFLRAFSSLGFSSALSACGRDSRGATSRANGSRWAGPREKNPLCFSSSSYGEISVLGYKVIGSAQRRWPEGFLQQGSIPLVLDRPLMRRVFRMPRGEAGLGVAGSNASSNASSNTVDMENALCGLAEFGRPVTLEALKQAVLEGFREVFGPEVVLNHPATQEVERTEALLATKYRSSDWTLRR